MMHNITIHGYTFPLGDYMMKLIEDDCVHAVASIQEGKPTVTLQTMPGQTVGQHKGIVGQFKSIDEANTCAERIADYLTIPCQLIGTEHVNEA